jgi:prepilin-type N-terminal cleavage/methylation domain-containing protein
MSIIKNKQKKNPPFASFFAKATKDKKGYGVARACPAKSRLTGRSRGFTLFELLVSMALFAIVIVIILGAITSITDANRKARTLMTVMNNLNFSVDAMTRSFNTGKNPSIMTCGGIANSGFSTEEIDYRNTEDSLSENIAVRNVIYCLDKTDGLGRIIKSINNGSDTVLTSPDIDIEYAKFTLTGNQPKLMINLEGTAKVGGKISSTFSIQNSVSQKYLNI